MISFFLTFLISSIVTAIAATFIGYWVHWSFHQPWALWFYHAHMNHHKVQYPATDFFSEKYRSAGKDNTVILFAVVFTPVILTILALAFFGTVSWTISICSLISLIAWGLIHNYVHDEFHLTDSIWKSSSLFLKWRSLHYIHHLDMTTNYGIVFFLWDRLFKTYIKETESTLTQGE